MVAKGSFNCNQVLDGLGLAQMRNCPVLDNSSSLGSRKPIKIALVVVINDFIVIFVGRGAVKRFGPKLASQPQVSEEPPGRRFARSWQR